MPEWLNAVVQSPLAGGIVSGLLFLGGIKAEMRAMQEKVSAALSSARRAHTRIDDHVDRHHAKGVA